MSNRAPHAAGDTKRSSESPASSAGGRPRADGRDWTRLSNNLVVACASWLGDLKSLLSLQTSCKAWSRVRADPAWRALYLGAYEPESADDAIIAVDGADNTSWKRRFQARLEIERNWQSSAGSASCEFLSRMRSRWSTVPRCLCARATIATSKC